MIFLVSAFQSYNMLEIKGSVVTAIIELQLALRGQLAFTKKNSGTFFTCPYFCGQSTFINFVYISSCKIVNILKTNKKNKQTNKIRQT